MMNHPTWKPLTETDPKPSDEGIPFSTDENVVRLVRIDIEANKRQFGRLTEGLCVTELSPDDLTPAQKRALFGDDHEA